MKSSQYLQKIGNNKGALYFHSLMGKLFLLDQSEIETLNMFSKDKTVSEEEKRQRPISDFISAGYITENDVGRDVLRQQNEKWMNLVAKGGQVRLLNLIISEICNFACPHCLHGRSVGTNSSHGRKKLMEWTTAKKSIDFYVNLMKSWRRNNLNVSFGSAEPLLNWDVLKQSIEYLKKIDPDVKLTINTNVSLIDPDKATFLKDNSVYVSTSLDGHKEGNDRIRIFSDQKGTYSKIISGFEIFKKAKYPLDGFSITINDKNFDYVTPDFIEWAGEQGFKGIATDIDIINTQNMGRPVDDYIEKLVELRKTCLKLGIENFGSWTTPYYNLVNGADDNMATFCKAVKGRNISINPKEKFFICGHTTTPIGDLQNFENTFVVGGTYFELVKSRLPGNDPFCKGCIIEGICSGQCQITREIAKNTGSNKFSVLCDFLKKVTFRLLEEKLLAELSRKEMR